MNEVTQYAVCPINRIPFCLSVKIDRVRSDWWYLKFIHIRDGNLRGPKNLFSRGLCLQNTRLHYHFCYDTRNTHVQRASCQVSTRLAQLCACMSTNDISDRDGHVHIYASHENRSLIQSLMHSAITTHPISHEYAYVFSLFRGSCS